MKKIIFCIGICILIYGVSSFKNEPHIGELLSKQLRNSIYNELDTAAFDTVFNETLVDMALQLKNGEIITEYFKRNGFTPILTLKFAGNGQIDSLVNYLQQSTVHGFKPSFFKAEEIKILLALLKSDQLNDVSEIYKPLARFEILIADAYLSYVKSLQFGLIDPKKSLSNYFIKTEQADETFDRNMLNSTSMLDTLRKQQVQHPSYHFLQNTFLQSKIDSVKKIIAINMERLRWNLPPTGEEFVQVNIPEFKLVYYRDNDTLSTMKICVGAVKDQNYTEKLKLFEQTGNYKMKPKNYQTPMLYGVIRSFFTNPVWIIPESIATNEIYEMASKNRYYLTKNKINVYYKNKLIIEPSKIRWSKYNRNRLPFRFEQQPGAQNSLGKFKFAFANNSGIFLHDTDFKNAFKLENRAISHGCIRIERPLELAKLLINDEQAYEQVSIELGLATKNNSISPLDKKQQQTKFKPSEAKMASFTPKKPIPILINYFTAWKHNDKIVFAKDIYGLDEQIWKIMSNMN